MRVLSFPTAYCIATDVRVASGDIPKRVQPTCPLLGRACPIPEGTETVSLPGATLQSVLNSSHSHKIISYP